MNIKNLFNILKKHSSIIIPCIILFAVATINSFMYIGLLEDGHHHFWEALTSRNIFLGHEGFSHFPFNSRYFPTILNHLSVGLSVALGIISIKSLLFIFTFVSYITPAFVLIIIYLNIPDDKKNAFEIILLSFLMCLVYMIYQIWTENLITGLFVWVVFVIYYYSNFNNLSKFNIISLILFSTMIISSHPMAAVFSPILIVTGIIKYFNTKNLKPSTNIAITSSFILLFFALLFNIYFIIHPIFPINDYLSLKIFKNINFIFFLISVLFILYLSFSKQGKVKCQSCTISFFILCALLVNILTFNVRTSIGFVYRVLGFYLPLFFIILILITEKLKLSVKTINIKILNIVLCFIILTNSFHYGISWKEYINSLEHDITKSKKANITEVMKYHIYQQYSLPFILIFIPSLSNNKNLKKYLPVYFFEESVHEIINRKKSLKKFNIDIDDIILYD